MKDNKMNAQEKHRSKMRIQFLSSFKELKDETAIYKEH
jgi:hypothetical protein